MVKSHQYGSVHKQFPIPGFCYTTSDTAVDRSGFGSSWHWPFILSEKNLWSYLKHKGTGENNGSYKFF